MHHPESENAAYERQSSLTGSPFGAYEAQWRYLGDRASADAAYCLRFGVVNAPEPFGMPSSVWSYAVPVVESKR
jgi:hypothetical protein